MKVKKDTQIVLYSIIAAVSFTTSPSQAGKFLQIILNNAIGAIGVALAAISLIDYFIEQVENNIK